MSCESSPCVSRLVRRAPKRGIIPLDHIPFPFPFVHVHRCFIRTVWIRYDNKRECIIDIVYINVPINVTGASRTARRVRFPGHRARGDDRETSSSGLVSVGRSRRVSSRRLVSSRARVRAFARARGPSVGVAMGVEDEDGDEDVVDVYATTRRTRTGSRRSRATTMSSSPSRGGARAGGRRKESETGAEDAARSLMLEVVREQRALLREERARGDEAEGELSHVTAQVDALSAKLDDISNMFATRRARGGDASSVETATSNRLRIENERLKREVTALMREMREKDEELDRLRARTSESQTVVTSESDARSASLGERRRLMRELAEARKEIAAAKQARAKALAEALELRKELEMVSSDRSETIQVPTADTAVENGGGAAGWADVDWHAAYAEMDSIKEEKRKPANSGGSLDSIKEIDWDAAYAEIEEVRARKRGELGEQNTVNSSIKI